MLTAIIILRLPIAIARVVNARLKGPWGLLQSRINVRQGKGHLVALHRLYSVLDRPCSDISSGPTARGPASR